MQAPENTQPDFSAVEAEVKSSIQNKIFPSASVIIANSQKVLFSKVFGTFTYESGEPIDETSKYDIASVSKVVGTLPAVMKVYEAKRIDLQDPVIKYIPEFNNNGKEDIKLLNLLLHNSGLPAFRPFYETVKTREEVLNSIFTCEKEYETGTKTVYSCFGFIILGEIVQRVTGKSLAEFASEEIFKPLEMHNTMYNPPEEIRGKIVPTELDNYWRHRLVQGTVHDETNDMLGGAAGNAGLFSTAGDLVKYMQMVLNNGTYTNSKGEKHQLFSEETVKLFTKCGEDLPYENSRALGWDTKPNPVGWGPACGHKFSKNSFGHTGFTGTSVWADREKDLIVIILTNRVYPNRADTQRGILDFRTSIHDKICDIMESITK